MRIQEKPRVLWTEKETFFRELKSGFILMLSQSLCLNKNIILIKFILYPPRSFSLCPHHGVVLLESFKTVQGWFSMCPLYNRHLE